MFDLSIHSRVRPAPSISPFRGRGLALLPAIFLILLLPLASRAAGNAPGNLPARGPTKKPAKKTASKTVQQGGVRLTYTPVKLSRGRGGKKPSTEQEIAVLLAGEARLQTKHSLSYRNQTLPPGDYPVKILRSPTKSFYFVIGEDPNPPKKTGKGRKRSRRPTLEGTRGHRGISERELESPEKGDGAMQGELEAGEDGEKDGEKSPGAGLRARIYFTVSRAVTYHAGFRYSLRSQARQKKVQIIVQAGGTEGKASLTVLPGK